MVRLHGIPYTIVCDRDKVFTSTFWKELMKTQGTQLCMSLAYHPQSDRQIEMVNKVLETYLRCFVFQQPHTRVKWLDWAKY